MARPVMIPCPHCFEFKQIGSDCPSCKERWLKPLIPLEVADKRNQVISLVYRYHKTLPSHHLGAIVDSAIARASVTVDDPPQTVHIDLGDTDPADVPEVIKAVSEALTPPQALPEARLVRMVERPKRKWVLGDDDPEWQAFLRWTRRLWMRFKAWRARRRRR